jgi:hypothetical protein
MSALADVANNIAKPTVRLAKSPTRVFFLRIASFIIDSPSMGLSLICPVVRVSSSVQRP